ncbi:MAG: hypothetical protein CGW95_04870 [Phenylobacterium zucineum]|nr:MAG: hypothetical protein CGW95_04870 [Phenylobacterium zucineum]
MTKEVEYFEIEISTYHGEPVGRIQFHNNGELEQSSLYSMNEINNIIQLWRMDELMGGFAIGTKLADKYHFQIFTRG